MLARILLIFAFSLVAGCGGTGTPGVPVRFLYASASAGPNEFFAAIYGFAVYSDGTLSPVPGATAPTSDGGGPVAITRDSKVLYTTNGNQLSGFQIQADGTLVQTTGTPFSMADTPVGIVTDPTADFLYASWSSGVLTVLAIDPATGALSLASSVTLDKFIHNAAAIAPSGRYLYQDDIYPDTYPATLEVAGFATDAATGALSFVPGSPLSSTHSAGTSGPMAIDPAGKFLYVSYEFAVTGGYDGALAAYSIDPASGALTGVPGAPFVVGGVPSAVAIDASGKFLIVSMYPPSGSDNCLVVFSIDPGTGALTAVPGSPFGPKSCAFVAADPSGAYVYVGSALQGENDVATITVLSLDQATGVPALVGQATIAGRQSVSSIALTH
jgi:6-phosphogluconolactonase